MKYEKMSSMSFGGFIRGFLAFILAYMSYHILDYSNIVALFYIISWIFYVFSRHYFNVSAWPSFIRITVGFLYGLILIFLMINSYYGANEILILAGFCATVSAWFLLLNWSGIFGTIIDLWFMG